MIYKSAAKIAKIVNSYLGWLFGKVTTTRISSMMVGALFSFTTNNVLDTIINNITCFLSIGGAIAGLWDKLDGNFNGKIRIKI